MELTDPIFTKLRLKSRAKHANGMKIPKGWNFEQCDQAGMWKTTQQCYTDSLHPII